MPTRSRARLVIALLGLIASAPTSYADEALPVWAREAMAAPTPTEAIGSDAVVLLRAGSIEMTGAGIFIERQRRAIRILTRDGSSEAMARAEYRTDGGKVRSLKAWMVAPSGEAHGISGKEAVDVSLAGSDIFSEARVLTLSGESDVVPGAMFAWESIVERRAAFAQFEWYFQDGLPTIRSEFAFRPPPERTIRATMLNGDSLPPVVQKGWWTWARAGLGPIRDEPYSPPLSSLASRLVVDAVPPSGAPETAMRSFLRWDEVAAWLHRVAEPSGAAGPTIASKARALAVGATTNGQKIRAIADFCQAVNYVSIQMGLSRGGGYVPHAAEDVLRNGYGDCKDKSNLMRALLRALAIDSYLCAISASDPDYVRESWPTPGQFDHCIIAVRSDDSAACSVSSAALGRLVLFDPTDLSTRWGDLPEIEQGGMALLVAPAGGELVRVPAAPPERSRHHRRVEATVAADGSVAGTLSIVATGRSASLWRATSRGRGASGLASSPQLWLGAAGTTAVIDSFVEVEHAGDDSYGIRASFRVPHFGRPMGRTLIVLEPGKLSTIWIAPPSEMPRSLPMMLPRLAVSDEFRLSLPAGYDLDGIPPPVMIEAPYGSYSATCRVTGNLVSIERALELRRSVLPAARSAEARDFLVKVKRALDTPLVLAKR